MLNFKHYPYKSLSPDLLYDILSIRSSVFVVEQHCFYQDPDGLDQRAHHLIGWHDNKIAAYLRYFLPNQNNPNIIFGRVLVAGEFRKNGYGKLLLTHFLEFSEIHFKNISIECSAQCYLQKFYESFGFKTTGEPYDDAGVQHIGMLFAK